VEKKENVQKIIMKKVKKKKKNGEIIIKIKKGTLSK